jgi:hypothetical protein
VVSEMAGKLILLVCEGETDLYIFEALAAHCAALHSPLAVQTLAPQRDATSGSYSGHGFGGVLNWCAANRDKLQMLIDFRGAEALFIYMDTDTAGHMAKDCIAAGHAARHCCQQKLNGKLQTGQEEPHRCHYILPTENTETWLLASHDNYVALDDGLQPIQNYENITAGEQHLIALGYKSKKGANKKAPRKLNKRPATVYKKHAEQLIKNLPLARQRCAELERLCTLLATTAAKSSPDHNNHAL